MVSMGPLVLVVYHCVCTVSRTQRKAEIGRNPHVILTFMPQVVYHNRLLSFVWHELFFISVKKGKLNFG